MPLAQHDRLNIETTVRQNPTTFTLGVAILDVLLSIDERLETTNDFYLQNQEERAQNGR